MNLKASIGTAGPRTRTILTGAILALGAAVLVPIPAAAAPTTHDVTLYGDGNGIQCTQQQERPPENCRGRTPDFYVAPGRVLAANGDTIRIANWGKGKAASYSPALAAPTNFPSTPSNGPSQPSCPSMNGGSYSIDNPCVISFVWTAPPTGTTTVTFGSDGTAGSKCPTIGAGGCFNKLVITNIPSQYPPSAPVVTSPVEGTISSNNILLEGHSAVNGHMYRAEIRSTGGFAPVMYEFYGPINGLAEFSDYLKNLVNGDYRVTMFSRNYEGFESKAAPIMVSLRGSDIEHPVLAWDPIQTVKGSFLGVNYSTSPISVSGVLRDDVRAKSVVVTVNRTTFPTSSTVLNLRCTRGYPENSNETVPCDSATNPQWIKWNGSYVGPPLYGSYSITVTVSDGVHPASSQTRSVTLTG